MFRSLTGLAASLIAALLGSTSPAACLPAFAAPALEAAPVAIPAPSAALVDRLRDMVRKGLVSLAVALVNNGTAIITNRMMQAGTAPKNIGWGTGTTPAAVTQSALVAEVAPTGTVGRTVGTESRTTVTVANDNYQVAGLVTATLAGPTAIAEAGLFDSATAGGGTMLIRGNFTAVNVNAGDSINFTFGLQFLANVV